MITLTTAARNACANAIDDLVNTGSGTATLVIKDGAVAVVTFNLQNPAFGAAVTGVITLQGVTISATAGANGPAVDGFDLEDRDGTVVLSGTVTATSGGGDIEFNNTNIASGQDCDLTSFTLDMPAS